MTTQTETTTYHADIDGGQGGDTTIEAATIEEAKRLTEEWADGGDWPEEGCKVALCVWPDGDDDAGLCWDYEIADTRPESIADENPDRVIAEEEGEYSTERLVTVEGDIYYGISNGGSRGAHDRQCGDGVWRNHPVEAYREIDRSDAVAKLLDWGYEPSDIADLLDD